MSFRYLMWLIACFMLFSHSAVSLALTTSYHIGNSLTWDSQPLILSDFALQRGLEHEVGHHIRCSQSLNYIVQNPDETCLTPIPEYGKFSTALTNHPWNAVTFQPHSNSNSTLATDISAILQLIDLTQSNPANANTSFYLYSAWPDSSNFQQSWNKVSADLDDTPTRHSRAYYTNLIQRVREATSVEVTMIPVGEVLYEIDLRMQAGEIPGFTHISQFYRDLIHMNSFGRYTAAVTTYSTLFGQDPTGLTKPTDWSPNTEFTPELYDAIHSSVRDVIATHPFTNINLPIPTKSDFDSSGLVDSADLLAWERGYGITILADTNSDNKTNGVDFLEWQRSFRPTLNPSNGNEADFTGDGFTDVDDLVLFQASFGMDEGGDADADGNTDGADFLSWQRLFTPHEAADFNQDKLIDGADLSLFSQSFGRAIQGDANDDGIANGLDFLAWQREFGRISLQEETPTNSQASVQEETPTNNQASVPEPSTFILTIALTVYFLASRSMR